jgi:hypothetical protein
MKDASDVFWTRRWAMLTLSMCIIKKVTVAAAQHVTIYHFYSSLDILV